MITRKEDFFKILLKTHEFPIGDRSILLHELTVAQRSRILDIVEQNPVKAQAHIVAMGCDLFDENDAGDIDRLLAMGSLVKRMADKIYELSAIAPESEDEEAKN